MKGKGSLKSTLVEVSPITKAGNPLAGTLLSYFSTERIAPGTLVRISLRKSSALAIVVRCRDAETQKSLIRRADFVLKKIRKNDILNAGLSPDNFKVLEEVAHHYATPIGVMTYTLLPQFLLSDPENFLKFEKQKKKVTEHRTPLMLQMESDERYSQYRALIRQTFARGKSVLFVVPTHLDALRVLPHLSKGIEEFVHLFTLSSKKADMKRAWQEALTEVHPILLVTTPAGLCFPRPDIDTVILERENSRAYRTLARPFIHYKIVVEKMAKQRNLQLVFGDSVLSLESLWREKKGEFGEESLIRWRLQAAPAKLIDSKSKQEESGEFQIFSPELKNLLQQAVSERERIFLFGARKGLSPTTVCGECGYLLPCLNCGAPVVLHRHELQTIYICHACGNQRDSTTTCGYCGSWKLVALGIGTEQIAEEVARLFPTVPVHILDKDYAPTDKQANEISKKFETLGGICVGTELAFFYLESVPYTALVSIDSLFSVPDFGINERIFYLVSRLREMTQKEAIVQTRNIGKQILAWAAQGNIVDFYQNEIDERQALLYPPFSLFIKITAPKGDFRQALQELKERLSKWHPDKYRDSLIIRLPAEEWPNTELIRELTLLGPEFSIKVDPESIL